MRTPKLFLAVAAAPVFAALALSAPALGAQPSEAERAAMQAAMVQYIDARTVDGLYPHVDLASGQIVEFAPAKSHPMIFRMGDVIVLCTDFKAPDGAATNVDFYLRKQGRGYAVINAQIANRAPLLKLMDAGKVESIE